MDTQPRYQPCPSAIHSHLKQHKTTATSLNLVLSHLITAKFPNSNHLNSPRSPAILATMSDNSGSSSSRDWNEVLKHGSALSILKPDVAFPPYGGSSTSGGNSGSSSGGSSGGGSSSSSSSYPSGSTSGTTQR